MAKRLEPITPGEILRDEFMAEYGLSQNKLALGLHVPPSIVNRIVNNKLRITADTATHASLMSVVPAGQRMADAHVRDCGLERR